MSVNVEQKVDKRITGIIRWLERLRNSYSSGAMENALMDAECARADLEVLRRDVWQRVQPLKHANPEFNPAYFLASCLRVISLAALIILLAVVPISRDVVTNLVPADNSQVAAEPEPAKISQVSQVSQVKHEHETFRKITPAKSNSNPSSSSRRKKVLAKTQVNNAKSESNAKSDAKKTTTSQTNQLGYDKVFSLIQTGERALRNESYVVINK